MEIGTPPKQVRQKILAHHLDRLPVSKEWIAQTAKDAGIVPGHVERAARVLQLVYTKDKKENENVLAQMLSNGRKKTKATEGLPEGYDLAYVNADQDLCALAEGLRKRGEARLLFYGAPGTGKTGFARYLSEHLERPLQTYTAADILGSYVGETERNIARIFDGAEADSILFLDEADSFLQIRSEAERHWEITQVNELLQRIERFTGVLICATNRKEGLDPAVLRRFDLQVEFLPLNYDQRLQIIQATLESMGLHTESEAENAAIQKTAQMTEGLVPGDMAILRRRKEINEYQSATSALLDIKNISNDKSRSFRHFGFQKSKA